MPCPFKKQTTKSPTATREMGFCEITFFYVKSWVFARKCVNQSHSMKIIHIIYIIFIIVLQVLFWFFSEI